MKTAALKVGAIAARQGLAMGLCMTLMTPAGWSATKKKTAHSAAAHSAQGTSPAAAQPMIQWLDKWPDGSPTGATFKPQGNASVIEGTAGNRSYGSVYQNLAIDMDRAPYVTVDVQSANGFWYIIVKNSRIPSGFVRVQPDTNLTGRQIYDLKTITGLSGRETIQMEIGISSGNPDPNVGKSMTFKDLHFTSREAVIPGALRMSPWMDTWPDGSPTGATVRVTDAACAVNGTSTKMPYGAIRRVVSVNLDKTPLLKIAPITVSAMWYMEATGGNLRAPVKIQADTDATQPQTYNLKELTGLTGDQSFELLVGVSSGGQDANNGKQFVFQDLSFVSAVQ